MSDRDVDWLEMKVDKLKTEKTELAARIKKVARLERALFGDGEKPGVIHD